MAVSRFIHDAWFPDEQLKYARRLGLPAALPGDTNYSFSPNSAEELAASAHKFVFTAPVGRDHSRTSIRQVGNRTEIAFPFAPFDPVNAIAVHGLQVIVPVVIGIVVSLNKNDWQMTEIEITAYSVTIILGYVALVLGAAYIASQFKSRLIIEGGEILSSVRPYGRQPRAKIEAIRGLCEGRRMRWPSWRNGIIGLWAITEHGSIPLAFGLDKATYEDLLVALRSVLARDRR